MNSASVIASCLAAWALLWAALLWLIPEKTKAVLLAFPRSVVPAFVLTAVGLAWSAWHFLQLPLEMGLFKKIKEHIVLFGGVVYGLILFFVRELLAVRALAGVMLLAGIPILDAIRWHDSAWRFTITVTVYIWVIKSLILLLHPWNFRKWVLWLFSGEHRVKTYSFLCVFYALLMLVSSWMLK